MSARSPRAGRYAAGLIGFLEVLDAARERNSAADAVVTAQGAVTADWAALQKALDGAWTPTEVATR